MALKLRNTLLVTGLAGSLIPFVLGRKTRWMWPLAHAAVIVPSVMRNSAAWGPLARRFETQNREIWLTIDDGPCTTTTPRFLEILDQYDARATFFMIGARADRLRSHARDVVLSGHGVGSHTYHHWSGAWWGLPPGLVRDQIERGHDAVQSATGVRSHHFRCPVGMTNPWVHPVLQVMRLHSIGWSASGVDGLKSRGAAVVDRIMRNLTPGGIIVLHESEIDGETRAGTLELLMQRLDADGWRCVLPTSDQFR